MTKTGQMAGALGCLIAKPVIVIGKPLLRLFANPNRSERTFLDHGVNA
jgi:hypothetical protein